MSHSDINADHLFELAGAICDETASDRERYELNSIMLADPTSRCTYLDYCHIHAALRLQLRANRATQKVHQQINVELVAPTLSELNVANVEMPASPTPTLLSTTPQGTVDYLSTDWSVAYNWSVSYLIATVIMGIGALIAGFTYVSHPGQIARQGPSVTENRSAPESQRECVGRITGMFDCKWDDPQTEAIHEAQVFLGHKYTLSSGLMEITYNTGAKVILQGPVQYEVEANNGGFMTVGKLTGKVTTANAKGFSVRTPTANVTDLGTEFGVEVDNQGVTTSHVFRGVVKVQVVAADGQTQGGGQLLRENQSARVDRGSSERAIVIIQATNPGAFVRDIPKLKIKMLDLVDVVAGGDGFSGRRNRGIDPITGRVADTAPMYFKNGKWEFPVGDRRYHRVEGLPFVDGVFLPNGSRDPVQTDSAGHTFAWFGTTSNQSSGYLWAVGVKNVASEGLLTELGGIEYGSPGHGALYLPSNNGVTFDLDAIRIANPGWKLRRFRAVAGNTGTPPNNMPAMASFWVLVDGQSRFQRRDIYSINGAFSVVVSIADNDRFLTLASTDSGDGVWLDWILFGDPRIEMWGNDRAATEPRDVFQKNRSASGKEVHQEDAKN